MNQRMSEERDRGHYRRNWNPRNSLLKKENNLKMIMKEKSREQLMQ